MHLGFIVAGRLPDIAVIGIPAAHLQPAVLASQP
jgi:hypothetical protein